MVLLNNNFTTRHEQKVLHLCMPNKVTIHLACLLLILNL